MQVKDKFLVSYIESALWSSTDEFGIPLDDSKYADAELSEETLAAMSKDCESFEPQANALIAAYNLELDANAEFVPREGHLANDFWLTRNHHGSGFWDGDYPEPLGKQLTDLAHSYGEFDLYVGDNGELFTIHS